MTTRHIPKLGNNLNPSSFFAAVCVRSLVAVICSFGLANLAFASGFVGKYTSEGKCSLTVEQMDMERGMSEGYYKVVSQGTGTCHWEGVGVAATTHLGFAALVSLSASLSFGDANWVFGPGGDQIEVTFFDTTGKQLFKQTYNRVK